MVDLAKLETDENFFYLWMDGEFIWLNISHVTIMLPLEDFGEIVELMQKVRKKFGDEGVLGVETNNCIYRIEACSENDGEVHLHIGAPGSNLMLTLETEQMSKFIGVCEKALEKLKEKGLA